MTVQLAPLKLIARPMTAGSALKHRRQSASLITKTCAAPALSSSSLKNRPICG